MSSHGIVLFGHGARDPRWAEPFERLAARLRGNGAPAPQVSLAFLELMTPSLDTAVAAQVAAGCTRITVVPVFFGQGGHVRRDLPQLVDACRAAHPNVEIHCATAVGEDDGVLDAIARYCIDQIGRNA
ncbi:sirohydrochlorin chelatase [Burkholderia ambifaria]|uniref:CbiX/SirB N-terminal domain-containing protein n=2 Tax=Burkholderia ambifaria TaxID=152480 RepID=A0AA41E684_9BURK|nr:CbiX/SirB N-terminal domain-containing protein [Burkholderia ambifaria]EDT05643.1 cobalamin (vitamin B12) biosynthesis CbiX protein [Burkholderia ambifaria IOP40-10]MBR8129125.1 CbiX/SirB N-terminal domain-containing protein [Burkholderia ambifaria]PRD97649.1 cobalamin biosynthesis protein CbiX [Burkholderia ambifaria]UEP47486.1 CbiX/SirB N-terminal domain-containing protein [Burkholderia ambifaria]